MMHDRISEAAIVGTNGGEDDLHGEGLRGCDACDGAFEGKSIDHETSESPPVATGGLLALRRMNSATADGPSLIRYSELSDSLHFQALPIPCPPD